MSISASNSHSQSLPDFDVPWGGGATRSFCRALWGGVVDGSLRPDSANRPNGLVRVSAVIPAAVQIALSILVARHPVLNCRIEERQGEPWLVPLSGFGLSPVSILDHGAGVDAADRAKAECDIGELVWRSFDVGAGPLYRAYAVCFGKDEAYLGLVVHHFIADGVAISVLMNEFQYIYERVIRRAPLTWAAPCVTYPSYLQAMNNWIERGPGARKLSEVVERLKVFPTFDLADIFDPEGSDEEEIRIEAPVAERVRTAARTLGVSPFTILLAAQTVWLARYCQGTVVPIKVITAGRELPKLANVVGNLADRMFVLTDLANCSSFSDVARQTQDALSWCRRHALVRFEFIQAAPAAAGISMAAPVFNFNTVRRAGPAVRQGGDVSIGRLRVPPPRTTKTRPRDVYYLVLTDNGEEMLGSIRYGQGYLSGFRDQFARILVDSCGDPSAPLALD